MSVRISANLPSRDFDATLAFYTRLGFTLGYRGDNWMILERDGQQVEFFPHPDLDPRQSWFSACLRGPDIDALFGEWSALDLPEDNQSIPRIGPPISLPDAPRMFTLIDPDGTLWRVMDDR